MDQVCESNNDWKNLGDINFLEYGGCLVRPHPEDESIFDVFVVNTECDDKGNIMAYLCTVDISDSWIKKEEVLYACGLEELWGKVPEKRIMSPQQWAKEIVEYYGAGEFSPLTYKTRYPAEKDDYFLSEEELETWIKDLGAWECIS